MMVGQAFAQERDEKKAAGRLRRTLHEPQRWVLPAGQKLGDWGRKKQPEDCGRLCVSRIARYFFRL
jgi:hypothetical protein